MDNIVQLIYTSAGYEVAEECGAVIPAWPVQDAGGHWHTETFPGQRVIYLNGNRAVCFGIQAVEVPQAEIPRDADGELCLFGLITTTDGRVWQYM